MRRDCAGYKRPPILFCDTVHHVSSIAPFTPPSDEACAYLYTTPSTTDLMTLPATSSASSLATSGSASPSPSFKKAKASYEIEQTLQFNNPTFEEAWRADAFRLGYLLHLSLIHI